MYYNKDEIEIRKLVSFYSIFNSIYFPLLILALFWTDAIYSAGKYKFSFIIVLIAIAELIKYFGSSFYLKTHQVNLSKKYDKNFNNFFRNLFSKAKIKEGLKNGIVVCFMIFVYFVISILYGAEVFSKHEETLMFSILLAVLTILPACVNLGSQSIISLILGSKPINKLESLLYQNLYLTIIGAWFGAFVIPLDWDRPWQVWPIPCSIGALFGFAISHFVMIIQVNINFKKKTKKSFIFQK